MPSSREQRRYVSAAEKRQIPFDPDLCLDCGAVVWDVDRHNKYHRTGVPGGLPGLGVLK